MAGGGYRVGEVTALKRKLSHTVFPQSDGYVESLLRDSARHGELVRTADLSGGADGLLAIYLVRYRLNESVNLMVHQHHYGAHRSPLSTAVVDARAEILPVKASSF